MAEAGWLAGDDWREMLALVSPDSSERKLRLLAVAAAGSVLDRITEGELRDAIATAERVADGLGRQDELDSYRGRFYGYAAPGATPEQREWLRTEEKSGVFGLVFETAGSPRALRQLHRSPLFRRGVNVLDAGIVRLVRDIFGNPFRPTTPDPSWRTSTVDALARQMYESRDFAPMPVLADALQDAGCDHPDVLDHSRGAGPHVRGCWVVDLILGKE